MFHETTRIDKPCSPAVAKAPVIGRFESVLWFSAELARFAGTAAIRTAVTSAIRQGRITRLSRGLNGAHRKRLGADARFAIQLALRCWGPSPISNQKRLVSL